MFNGALQHQNEKTKMSKVPRSGLMWCSGLVAELTAVRLNDLAAPPEPLQLGWKSLRQRVSKSGRWKEFLQFFTRGRSIKNSMNWLAQLLWGTLTWSLPVLTVLHENKHIYTLKTWEARQSEVKWKEILKVSKFDVWNWRRMDTAWQHNTCLAYLWPCVDRVSTCIKPEVQLGPRPRHPLLLVEPVVAILIVANAVMTLDSNIINYVSISFHPFSSLSIPFPCFPYRSILRPMLRESEEEH